MNRDIQSKNLKGFSLFEIIITVGILLVITIIVFPIAVNKAQQSRLDTYASELSTDIYYQQQRSSLKGIAGGLVIQNNGYIIFDGGDYSTSTETDTKILPSGIRIENISLISGNEIRFEAGEFKPSVYGSMVVTDGVFSVRVYINQEGLVVYERL